MSDEQQVEQQPQQDTELQQSARAAGEALGTFFGLLVRETWDTVKANSQRGRGGFAKALRFVARVADPDEATDEATE